MSETKIRWPWKPLYTFNPVVGCARQCPWCYAAKISNRFRMVPDFTKPVFFHERLKQRFKPGSHVFIGSMSDIEYWKKSWVGCVTDYCCLFPEVNFYFLSKNPMAYHDYDWPENCCLGLTMTLTQDAETQMKYAVAMVRYRRAFLSIEPLLGNVKINKPLHLFEKIIVGSMTGPGAIKPRPEWVDSIKRLKLDNVFWKPSMKQARPGEGK